MSKKPVTNARRKLTLNTEKLRPIEKTDLDGVVGGRAAGTEFPCWTQNNCPTPA